MKIGIIADVHIRGKSPINRTDDFYQSIMTKFKEALSIFKKKECDIILDAGDLLHSPIVSLTICDDIIDAVDNNGIDYFTLFGNHPMLNAHIENSKATTLAHMFRRSTYLNYLGHMDFIEKDETVFVQGKEYYHGMEEDIKKDGLYHKCQNDTSIVVVHAMITEKKLMDKILHIPYKDLKTNYDYVIVGHNHCTSHDTECLTENGWKKYNEVSVGDKIATFNMKKQSNYKIEYQPIQHLTKYNYKGKMLNFKHDKWSKTDILVTPNHRMVTTNGSRGIHPSIKLAYALKNGQILINSKNWDYDIKHKFKNPYWAMLIGFILGDGHYKRFNKNSDVLNSIEIYQKIGNNHRFLKNLFKKARIPYKYWKGKIGETWTISNRHSVISKEFLTFMNEKVNNKQLNRTLISLPKKQLLFLFKGLIASDGHRYSSTYNVFAQADFEFIKLFEELCLRLGRKFVTVKGKSAFQPKNDLWRCHVTKQYKTLINEKNIKEIDYNNIVWCPTVANGTWIAKRNGIPFITGNCEIGIQKVGNTTVIGLGALARLTADKKDYMRKPKIAILDTETKDIEVIELKTAKPYKEVFNLELIAKKKSIDNNLEAFVNSLDKTELQSIDTLGLIVEIGKKQNVDKNVINSITKKIEELGDEKR